MRVFKIWPPLLRWFPFLVVSISPFFISGCNTGVWRTVDDQNSVSAMVLPAEDRVVVAHPVVTTIKTMGSELNEQEINDQADRISEAIADASQKKGILDGQQSKVDQLSETVEDDRITLAAAKKVKKQNDIDTTQKNFDDADDQLNKANALLGQYKKEYLQAQEKYHALIKALGLIGGKTTTIKAQYVCAEPSPDAISSLLTQINANYNKGTAMSAAINSSISDNVQNVSVRTVALEMVRELRYGLCEESANDKITSEQTNEILTRIEDGMVVLLSIDKLTDKMSGNTSTVQIGESFPKNTPLSLNGGSFIYLPSNTAYMLNSQKKAVDFTGDVIGTLKGSVLGKLDQSAIFPLAVNTPITLISPTQALIPVGTEYYLDSNKSKKTPTVKTTVQEVITLKPNDPIQSISGVTIDEGNVKSDVSESIVSAVHQIAIDYLKKDEVDRFMRLCEGQASSSGQTVSQCFNELYYGPNGSGGSGSNGSTVGMGSVGHSPYDLKFVNNIKSLAATASKIETLLSEFATTNIQSKPRPQK